MDNAVFVTSFDVRRVFHREQVFNFAPRITVEHEDLPKMGASGPKQLKAIRFGFGQCLLVPKNYAGGIVFDSAEGDESLPLRFFVPTRNCKALRVNVDRRLWVLKENALTSPIAKKLRGASVRVLSGMASGVLLTQNDADKIVRTRCVVTILHLWCDLVVWLSYYVSKRNACRIITKSAKGFDVSHDWRIQILQECSLAGDGVGSSPPGASKLLCSKAIKNSTKT